MINPRHMITEKPVNANDEDLVDGMKGVGQPIDQPTSMSYCLQRYRLAEICREITDSEPFAAAGVGQIPYEKVREIDSKMAAFLSGLPSFFSLDFNVDNLPETDPRRSNPITVQRYIMNSLSNAQRCRLHLPYLTRSSKEPKYRYSRDACLGAARMVIRTERQLQNEDLPFLLMRLRSSGILHCVCMAIIVLLMDLCLNRNLPVEDDRELRMEILGAFSVLEEAKGQTPFAERILESFYSVMKRYNIPFGSSEAGVASRTDGRDHNTQPSVPIQHLPGTLPGDDTSQAVFDPALPSFDDLLQEFDMNVDPMTLDWDTLFSELESPFISI